MRIREDVLERIEVEFAKCVQSQGLPRMSPVELEFRDYVACVGSMPLVRTIESRLVNASLGLSGELQEMRMEWDKRHSEEEDDIYKLVDETGDVWWYTALGLDTIIGGLELGELVLTPSVSDNYSVQLTDSVLRFSELTKKVVVHQRDVGRYKEDMADCLVQVAGSLCLMVGPWKYVWAQNITKLVMRYGYKLRRGPAFMVANPKEST